jgi:hypothetical protein
MEENIKSKSKIVLVDSFSQFEKILPYFNEKNIIYAFDNDSHIKLKKNSFSHKLSESFLSEKELEEIQKNVYKFSSWYNFSGFNDYLIYEGMNIGRLFHEEFLDYLVQFLKKFYEIFLLVQQHPKSEFIAGGELFEILNLFSKNNHKIEFQTQDYSFTHDKVRFSLPIGSKSISLFLPFTLYKTIKNFSEKVIQFNSNKNYDSTVLMVELNTIRFKKILMDSKLHGVPISLFGLRRPAVWNLESYKIVKNSNCKIITQHSLLEKDLDTLTQSQIIKNNFNKLFKSEVFGDYFSLFQIDFSSLINKILKELVFERLNTIVNDITSIKSLFLLHKIKSIILLSEVGYTEQLILNFALKNKIPAYMLHLGLHYDTFEAKEMNSSQSVYPILSEKFLVWGDIAKEDAKIRGEIPENKIIVTGNPRFDDYHSFKNDKQEYVLLATSGPQHEDVNGLLIKNIENYEKVVSEICKTVSSSGRKLVIKLHPSVKEHDITNIAKSINPEITIFKEGEIYPLIQNCSCMIVLGLSTAIIEAQLLKKPVISIPVIDYKLGNPSVFTSDSCIISDSDKLKNNLEKLDDKEFRNNIVAKADSFLDSYLKNSKNATQVFFNYLKKS